MLKSAKMWFGQKMEHLHKDVRGMEALEYLLIAALVVIASVAAYRYLGKSIQTSAVAIGDATIAGVEEGITASGLSDVTVTKPSNKPNIN